jgi:hypothetical protein
MFRSLLPQPPPGVASYVEMKIAIDSTTSPVQTSPGLPTWITVIMRLLVVVMLEEHTEYPLPAKGECVRWRITHCSYAALSRM